MCDCEAVSVCSGVCTMYSLWWRWVVVVTAVSRGLLSRGGLPGSAAEAPCWPRVLFMCDPSERYGTVTDWSLLNVPWRRHDLAHGGELRLLSTLLLSLLSLSIRSLLKPKSLSLSMDPSRSVSHIVGGGCGRSRVAPRRSSPSIRGESPSIPRGDTGPWHEVLPRWRPSCIVNRLRLIVCDEQ